MNNHTCCSISGSMLRRDANQMADGKTDPPSAAQPRFTLAKCSVPTVILALLPKCPACLAAYVALGTGISLSTEAASFLRTLLIATCVATLVWILISLFRTVLTTRFQQSRFYKEIRVLTSASRRLQCLFKPVQPNGELHRIDAGIRNT